VEDRLEIADLINRWAFYRDQERWQALRETFAPAGTISISWFSGTHDDFVTESMTIAARGRSTLKHQLGVPAVTVNGERALSEVNVVIMVRASTPAGEIDTSSFARFLDRMTKVDGRWRFVERVGIYEKDRIDPVDRPALPAGLYEGAAEHPREIRFLARSLTAAGLSVSPRTVLDKSEAMRALYRDAERWLEG